MTDSNDLAARLYPDLAPPDPAPIPTEPRVMEGAPQSAPDPEPRPADEPVTVESLVDAEQDMAERLYGDGSFRPDSPEGYTTTLDDGFALLEREAREQHDEAAQSVLAEGRRESAALLHELAVPKEEAAELVRTLGDWNERAPLTEDQRWDAKEHTITQLSSLWGPQTHARITLAQRTAAEACKRLPWLADLLANGAGNDPAVIKRFAEIGLRQARRASKVGKDRNG